MKKIIFAASLLLGLSVLFSSCDKSGTENMKDDEYPIVGCWITDADNLDDIDGYSEFTNTGLCKTYSKDYSTDENATFKDGVLSYPGGWKIDDELYKYWIEDGLLYLDEEGSIDFFDFEMIGKDKFCCYRTNNKGKRMTTTFFRIKKFTK